MCICCILYQVQLASQRYTADCNLHDSVTIQGLPTIRAYDVSDHFKELFVAALDRNGSWWYAFLACSRWVGFRLDTLAAITLSFECILVMAIHDRVSLAAAITPSLFSVTDPNSDQCLRIATSLSCCTRWTKTTAEMHTACNNSGL